MNSPRATSIASLAGLCQHRGRRSAHTKRGGMMSDSTLDLLQEGERARREGRLADAHHIFTEAIAASRDSGTRSELIRALKGLGQIERDLDQADAARPLYEEAVALCRQEGEPLLLAQTVRHLGDIHHAAGKLKLAEPCYQEAIALYRAQSATLELANAIRPLAILKSHAGQMGEARGLWSEARTLYLALNVADGAAECTYRLLRMQDE
ncbi:MAG: tetratricopeptide repeat protein [Pseudomonadota bacterium]